MLDEFYIKINWKVLVLDVDLAPKSGEGHNYMFSVNILTGKIDPDSISIGEIEPEPMD